MNQPDQLRDDARAMRGELVALRRGLHQIPEVGLDLPRTQAALLAALEPLGLETSVGTGCTSITVHIGGDAPGPTVLLRADMDALPVHEASGLDFASTNGAMHACGHDLHMAGLVGAVRLLAARREMLRGSVVAVFQPGEEGHHGAEVMLQEGVLEVTGELPVRAYALHVFSHLARGVFTTRPGPIMAAVDKLDVTVNGRGGHGALPHRTIDPVPIALEIATALQTYISRRIDVFDPAVLTVGRLEAGSAYNVIPDGAVISAGIRTFSSDVQARLSEELPRLAGGIAEAHGATATTSYTHGDPVTSNDPNSVDDVRQVVSDVLGSDGYVELEHPVTVAEDFSRILRRVPGAMVFLGAAVPGTNLADTAVNHSSRAVFDDSVLGDAAAVLAALALAALDMERETD